ncbi:MAG TPA: hypothetical protein DDZ80_10750 [Cyanobacteria bacterium UBA8803]|nr:hypothetical protein [Cyanobacteria bacterium UBA9273]HBL58970.1 hypothetical protein [Cyanobacteria bacterium UBA8803]
MSQRDGFGSGFLAGVLVGGLIGGVIGTLVAAGRNKDSDETQQPLLNSSRSEAKALKKKKSQLQANEESIELARRSLEDKIAQLNTAIDDVRQQLGTVNGNPLDLERQRSLDS